MAEDNRPLVLATARRMNASVRRLGWDEAVSVGHLALVEAAHRYKPLAGLAFSTYASKAIERAIGRACKGTAVAPLKTDPEAPRPDDKSELLAEVRRVVQLLQPWEGEILSAYFGIGRPKQTLARLAESLGVCEETASRRVRDALDSARSLFATR